MCYVNGKLSCEQIGTLFSQQTLTTESFDLASGDTVYKEVAITIPTGYRIISIIPRLNKGSDIVNVNTYVSNTPSSTNSIIVNVHSYYSSTFNGVIVTLYVILAKF